jgi:hypothetical protein
VSEDAHGRNPIQAAESVYNLGHAAERRPR